MCEVMTIGEPMVMFLADTKEPLAQVNHFTKMIAGAELNVAIGLQRLGHSVSYATQVGNDPLGEYIINFLHKESIDTSNIKKINDAPTGFQLKNQTDDGNSEVIYFRKGSAASKTSAKLLSSLKFNDTKILHITGIFPALSPDTRQMIDKLIDLAHEHNILVTFDHNSRPVLWKNQEEMISTTNEIACKCDIVMPGLSEGRLFTKKQTKEEIADFYLNQGVSKVIIKLGDTGSYMKERLSDGSYREFTSPSFKVKVVDTVGTGDGFASGILSGLLEQLDNEKILERGNAIGAIQVTNLSDNAGLPTISELNNFIKNTPRKQMIS